MNNTELFTGKAEAYAKARPEYAADAIQYIRSLIPEEPVIAEIGAGTGKLTLSLAAFAKQVFAVEPNDDMRLQLSLAIQQYPNISALDATAEQTGLPDHCADAIICAQALHWFDLAAYREECHRIGKPDAVVIAVYNNLTGGDSAMHSTTSTKDFFGDPVMKEFSNPIFYTREHWLTYMTTHSKDPLAGSVEYEAHLAEMNRIFDEESSNGILTRHLQTSVYHKNLCDL